MSVNLALEIIRVVIELFAVGTLFLGFWKFRQGNLQRRTENFARLRAKFHEIEGLPSLLEKLDLGQDVTNVSYRVKLNFIGLYEDLFILFENKLIEKNVALYMFGFYAMKCEDSDTFWAELSKEDPYWTAFHQFASEAKAFTPKIRANSPVVMRKGLLKL